MSPSFAERQRRLLLELQKRSLVSAYLDPALRNDLEAEAADPELPEPARLVRRDMLDRVKELLADPERRPDLVSEAPGVSARSMSLFFSTDLVVVVPGFLGSTLSDVTPGGFGLIWVNPIVAFRDRLGLLQLGPYADPERDLDPRVEIAATGVLPLFYDLLRIDLEPRRYSVGLFPVDWRRDLEVAAGRLRDHLREMVEGNARPIHLIAHSQGAMVARRGLQLLRQDLGEEAVLDRVRNLVLLGPANAGSFSAAFAAAGNHDFIRQISPYIVAPEQGFGPVLRSMSGVYQLLPWNPARLPVLDRPGHQIGKVEFWPEIDAERLRKFYGWARTIDTTFFNERTLVLLGDHYAPDQATTVAGVAYHNGELKATHVSRGDGTVPDACAFLDGVPTYRARNTEHMRLPTYPRVLRAVRDQLAGRPIQADANLAAVDRADALDPGHELEQARPFAAFAPGLAAPLAPTAAPGPPPPAAVRQPRRTPPPPFRRLRTFAFDPSLSRRLETSAINRVTLNVPWEEVEAGPVGEYLEVIDVDPSSGCLYHPVDLNDPHLLASDGLAPSEGNPQFHQQMVYAVAMTAIRTFEDALGRTAEWSPRLVRDDHGHVVRADFVRRLRIYPHALREANAYYSPQKKALLFGYFAAPAAVRGLIAPGGTVFACLSHGIVAHETTHALLDGLHRYFGEPSNPDVLAFHEAFADVVALLLHFSHTDVLRDQIARTRGDLAQQENLLGALAVEFGQARGLDGALRDAIGKKEDGRWVPRQPKETDYESATEPHDRGAVLVAAVFDAFLTIYKRRILPLLRVSSGGTGLLPAGEIHPDLVSLLCQQAAKSARHVLQMCVRALDYCPPVDVTFGEYLRALVTADADLVPDDDLNYRLAVIEAFARRGIYPPDVRSLSEENLLWREPPGGFHLGEQHLSLLRNLSVMACDPSRSGSPDETPVDREKLFGRMRDDGRLVHELLLSPALPPGFDRFLGLALGHDAPSTIRRGAGGRPRMEVHSVRPALRVGPDGQSQADLLIEITQRRLGYLDEKTQREAESRPADAELPQEQFAYRGGSTVLIDMRTSRVRYVIAKDILGPERLRRQRDYLARIAGDRALELTYQQSTNGQAGEPFAVLHRI
jgi:hypothetical protein